MRTVSMIAVCALAIGAWAQNDGQLTAREVFFIKVPAAKPTKPVVKPTLPPGGQTTVTGDKGTTKPAGGGQTVEPVAYMPLALRYSILQKKGNSFDEVDADSEFHSGDRVRVRVESNGTAYLYIVQLGSSGKWRVLFPSKEIDGGNNRIESGRP